MHTIRLRHPWKRESQDGIARWSRSFNWPADNAPDESVYLAVRPWHEDAQVLLNDQVLQSVDATSRCDVTSLLAESNRLQISLPEGDEQFPLEVQLEIVS